MFGPRHCKLKGGSTCDVTWDGTVLEVTTYRGGLHSDCEEAEWRDAGAWLGAGAAGGLIDGTTERETVSEPGDRDHPFTYRITYQILPFIEPGEGALRDGWQCGESWNRRRGRGRNRLLRRLWWLRHVHFRRNEAACVLT